MAEKEEESKLKMKYPSIQRPGPQFLQKRLQKGVSAPARHTDCDSLLSIGDTLMMLMFLVRL